MLHGRGAVGRKLSDCLCHTKLSVAVGIPIKNIGYDYYYYYYGCNLSDIITKHVTCVVYVTS